MSIFRELQQQFDVSDLGVQELFSDILFFDDPNFVDPYAQTGSDFIDNAAPSGLSSFLPSGTADILLESGDPLKALGKRCFFVAVPDHP